MPELKKAIEVLEKCRLEDNYGSLPEYEVLKQFAISKLQLLEQVEKGRVEKINNFYTDKRIPELTDDKRRFLVQYEIEGHIIGQSDENLCEALGKMILWLFSNGYKYEKKEKWLVKT